MKKLLALICLVISAAAVSSSAAQAQVPPAASPAPTLATAPVRCAVAIPSQPTEADIALAAGDYSKAEALYTAQTTGAQSAAPYVGLVESQLQQDKLDAALASGSKAVATMPNSPDAHTALGEALQRDGQIPEASAEFTRALSIDHCSARAHYGAGKLLRLASMNASAQRELALAHQLAPRDYEIQIAWMAGLPPVQQAAVIQQFLKQHPAGAAPEVPSEQRHRLEIQGAILEQGKSCSATAPFDKATLELKPLMFNGIHARDWGLQARVNDRSNFLLELDTTVSGVVLGRTAAAKAGVEPIIKGDDAAAAGYMGFAGAIKIGKIELKDCPVKVVNDSALAGGNSLISPRIFADHAININFATRIMALTPLPAPPSVNGAAPGDRYIAPEMQAWSRVYLVNGRIAMPTTINKSRPYLFLLDTGAPLTIISPAAAARVLSLGADATAPFRGSSSEIVKFYEKSQGGTPDFNDVGASLDVADLHDASGKLVKVFKPFKVPTLDFARVSRIDDSSFSFDITPLSDAAGVEVSGLIGFSILKDLFISIDYRDGLIKLDFDSNYLYRSREGTY